MGRPLAVVSLCFLLTSCGPTGVLCTDAAFRLAAPEIVAAWNAEGPFRDARSVALKGNDLSTLRPFLSQLPAGTTAFLALSLAPEDRSSLLTGYPKLHFIVLGDAPPDMTSFAVSNQQALVAVFKAVKAASGANPIVLLPPHVGPQELQALKQAGTLASIAEVDVREWPEIGDLLISQAPVVQWAGPAADSTMIKLSANRLVGAPPDATVSQGATLITWAIDDAGLSDLLWKAVANPQVGTVFFPLKTVSVRR